MVTINDAFWSNKEHTAMTVIFSGYGYKNMPFGVNLDVSDDSELYKEFVEKLKSGNIVPKEYIDPEVPVEDVIEFIKNRRNRLLNNTDKYMTLDFPLSDEDKNEIKQFRQQLRDITKQIGFPDKVKWPTPPDCIKDQINMPS